MYNSNSTVTRQTAPTVTVFEQPPTGRVTRSVTGGPSEEKLRIAPQRLLTRGEEAIAASPDRRCPGADALPAFALERLDALRPDSLHNRRARRGRPLP